jgi:hypothetical protein
VKVVTTDRATGYIRERGGHLWVWLDPHRCLVGSYVYLEAHTEPAGTSRETKFTRSSRRPHSFGTLAAGGFDLHYDWGRLDPPEELHIDLRGWVNKRVEAYWNGCVFVDTGVPRPAGSHP